MTYRLPGAGEWGVRSSIHAPPRRDSSTSDSGKAELGCGRLSAPDASGLADVRPCPKSRGDPRGRQAGEMVTGRGRIPSHSEAERDRLFVVITTMRSVNGPRSGCGFLLKRSPLQHKP